MKRSIKVHVFVTSVGWMTAIIIFFPIFWTVLISFKTEIQAVDSHSLFSIRPTLEAYKDVLERSNYWSCLSNTIVEAFGATFSALLLSIPAAYHMAFLTTSRTRTTLLWMLSTKMMPPISVLIPIYLIARSSGLLDSRIGMTILYTLMNLPVVVWMLFAFFREIPREILESGRMDGASLIDQFRYLLIPLSLPGIASTSLFSIVLCWNEAFWSLNLTSVIAAPLTQFITSFASPKGLFLSKLSAASTLAVLPILAIGWLSQKQLLRGFGVKRG